MGDHRTPEERRADRLEETADSVGNDVGRIADALERIQLELEIANRIRMFEAMARAFAVDKALQADFEKSRVELNSALHRRSAE